MYSLFDKLKYSSVRAPFSLFDMLLTRGLGLGTWCSLYSSPS
jgi:hypothetical protein